MIKPSPTEIPVLKQIHTSLEDTKAENIVILSLKNIGAFTDYLVIASANNTRQVAAIADRIALDLKKSCNVRPLGTEGTALGQWVLIDFGDIICHIFLDEIREFYRLEDMWKDADVISQAQLVQANPAKKQAKPKTSTSKANTKKSPKTQKSPVAKVASKKPAQKAKTPKKAVSSRKQSVKK